MKKKPSTKPGSVQALLGMRRFTENGILTDNGELIFFRVQPTNISVLSPVLIEQRIDAFTKLLHLQVSCEILCCDAHQSFEVNKLYLRQRRGEEAAPEIQALLDQEEEFLDNIQSNMATSREFFFVLRLKGKEGAAAVSRFEKRLDEQGFFPAKLSKDDLKRLIARYFGYDTETPLPDFDGA